MHPFDSRHRLKEDILADAEAKKNRLYKEAYHGQGHAFAPLACNSFGQQGPDLLRYLWLVADRHAQRKCSDFLYLSASQDCHDLPRDTGSGSQFKVCRARLYRQSVQEVLIAIYEAVNERVLGRTSALQAYPKYRAFFHAPLPARPLLPPVPPAPSSPLAPLPAETGRASLSRALLSSSSSSSSSSLSPLAARVSSFLVPLHLFLLVRVPFC